MATEVTNELAEFQRFVNEQVATHSCKSVEELLTKLKQYCQEREQFRRELQPALEQSERGESKLLDAEALKARVTQRLAERGIVD